uniref:Uncharacterized protein n=1 Tax=Anopheles dirus TaxID=7168 RepID=A0A182MYR3_9DIPT
MVVDRLVDVVWLLHIHRVPVKVPVYHKQVVEVAKPYPVPVEKAYPVYVKQPHYVHKSVYDHESTVYGSSPVAYEHKQLWG